MTKTIRNKKTKQKRKSRKQKLGGSYYRYNTNPLRFTSSTTQMGGGFSMDSRNTFFPSTLISLGRDVVYNLTPTIFFGRYNGVDPNPIKQQLGK